MLKGFKVKNFKGFKDELYYNLSNTNNYEFNCDAVKDGIITKSMVFGHNGCGKSNLGLALFDVVLHLTDKEKRLDKYNNYLNMNSKEKVAHFEYYFVFFGIDVVYKYTKEDAQNLKNEELIIDGETVVEYDFTEDRGFCLLDGTQNLRMESPDGKLSKLKFIKNNAILEDNITNKVFYELMNFVDNMLMFYCLEERGYQGLMLGVDSLDDIIVKSGKLQEFEKFLHKAEIKENLTNVVVNGQNQIHFVYKNGLINIHEVASTGTKALELFYYWLIKMEQASLVFIDEFDAFYHHELAELIMKELGGFDDKQIIVTTHNTDLISNDILRPDCYYKLEDNGIDAFSGLTKKELRRAHNIQKMYKSGVFDE